MTRICKEHKWEEDYPEKLKIGQEFWHEEICLKCGLKLRCKLKVQKIEKDKDGEYTYLKLKVIEKPRNAKNFIFDQIRYIG